MPGMPGHTAGRIDSIFRWRFLVGTGPRWGLHIPQQHPAGHAACVQTRVLGVKVCIHLFLKVGSNDNESNGYAKD